ncbi:MAG TPA: 2-oxoglutarate dehydrogenase E1 component, partial [Psychromonas hadalis]|nr:2-oxoglutarate dehydrogenase E1 component [Psychromonas hadalis]
MANNEMEVWLSSSHLSGANATYIEDLYEQYLQDPVSVDANWRELFDDLPKVSDQAEEAHSVVRAQMKILATQPKSFAQPKTVIHNDAKQVRVLQLIGSYRNRGHEVSKLDPLELRPTETVQELDPFYHELQGSDL